MKDILTFPTGKVDVILDTDAYNEIDDQFAIAYLVKSKEKLNVLAVNAAPFFNKKSSCAEEGMERSFYEIKNILSLMDEKAKVFKGSKNFMADTASPEQSEAAINIIEQSKKYSKENPLYVLTIGAATNVSSAILLDPTIVDRIVVVWLGGHAFHWNNTAEFNLIGDFHSSKILFDSKVPLVQFPCMGVVSHCSLSIADLDYYLKRKNKLCDYLVDITKKEMGFHNQKSRVIWDITTIAYLINEKFYQSRFEHSPILNKDFTYSFDNQRHLIKYVYYVNKDLIFADLFSKICK